MKLHSFSNQYIRSQPWVKVADTEVWFTDKELDELSTSIQDNDFSRQVFIFLPCIFASVLIDLQFRQCRAHAMNLQVQEKLRQAERHRSGKVVILLSAFLRDCSSLNY